MGKLQGELSRELGIYFPEQLCLKLASIETNTISARFFDANSGRLLTESQSSQRLITSSEKTPLKPEGLELDPADLERLANLFDLAASHLFTV